MPVTEFTDDPPKSLPIIHVHQDWDDFFFDDLTGAFAVFRFVADFFGAAAFADFFFADFSSTVPRWRERREGRGLPGT